ncbi:MAG TPA: tetratricopeptide repeat protein [Candidatus Obscuribacterales bacterium]
MAAECCNLDNQGRDLALARVLHLGAHRFWQEYGNTQEAEHLYKTALMVLDHVQDDHPELAETLIRLKLDMGSLYYEGMGKLKEAEALTREGLGMAEQSLGQDHFITAYAANNLGDICTLQGRFAEAEEHYRRALAILEKNPGPQPQVLNVVLAAYAAMLRLAGREQDANAVQARIPGSAPNTAMPESVGAQEGTPGGGEAPAIEPAADAAPTNPAHYQSTKNT